MKRDQRRAKSRVVIRGTESKPRLVIFRSSKYLYAQAIDDVKGHTLAAVNKIKDAVEVGKAMAKALGDKKIKEVVFDRAGYRYHGKIKKIAETAREAGIKI